VVEEYNQASPAHQLITLAVVVVAQAAAMEVLGVKAVAAPAPLLQELLVKPILVVVVVVLATWPMEVLVDQA
jgi:hypothetical protein